MEQSQKYCNNNSSVMKGLIWRDYSQELVNIKDSQLPPKIKILQVEALIHQIKFRLATIQMQPSQHRKSVQDTFSTALTNQIPEPVTLNTIQQLQNKIILKRDMKFELNEQLEEIQDQLQAIEKTVHIKQQIQDSIRRKIDKTRMQIQLSVFQKKNYNKAPAKQSKNKTFSNFSNKVKSLFS